MKTVKLLFLTLLFTMTIPTCYALQITSNENGPVHLPYKQLRVGDQAPRITLVTSNFKKRSVGGATGKVQIISTIESFNTSVCDQQTMALNKLAKQLRGVTISVVTTNQPFVIGAFKAKHKINNVQLLSAFNNSAFGKAYGVQVIGGQLEGITARSIFVINKQGKIVYKEITKNIDRMPNIKAAVAAAKKAAQ